MKSSLERKFQIQSNTASKSKLSRWFDQPWRHFKGFSISYLVNPIIKIPIRIKSTIFTGDIMALPLPAGLDLYLMGLKVHDSEIRLVRYLFSTIKTGDIVIDSGAHVGYYSIILSRLIGNDGFVIAPKDPCEFECGYFG